MTMKKLFVPYELALKAKENGFDEETLAHYLLGGNELFIAENKYMSENHTKAPLHQQLTDWFREKHKLIIYISFTGTTHKGVITWKPKKNEYTGMLPRKETIDKKDYYKVLNNTLEKAFELIKK